MKCKPKHILKYMGADFIKTVTNAGLIKSFVAFLIAGTFGLIMAAINTTVFIVIVIGIYLCWGIEAHRECTKVTDTALQMRCIHAPTP